MSYEPRYEMPGTDAGYAATRDLSFKYRRFQTRDLPPIDRRGLQVKLTQKIEELEAHQLRDLSKK
eukprot:959442-Rhodomonas_salina.1